VTDSQEPTGRRRRTTTWGVVLAAGIALEALTWSDCLPEGDDVPAEVAGSQCAHLAGAGGLEPPRRPELRPCDRTPYGEELAGPVALGESKLTFHGSSYGTLLGEQYAEVYPQRVRAVVLESVVDHSLGTRPHSAMRLSAPSTNQSGRSWPAY
jgi:pimeloyl-ACP methyl ester carboxylesterase